MESTPATRTPVTHRPPFYPYCDWSLCFNRAQDPTAERLIKRALRRLEALTAEELATTASDVRLVVRRQTFSKGDRLNKLVDCGVIQSITPFDKRCVLVQTSTAGHVLLKVRHQDESHELRPTLSYGIVRSSSAGLAQFI